MKYCNKCVYPENARPHILLDQEGVCSGCRAVIRRKDINWENREGKLEEIVKYYKEFAREQGNSYDCVIPVSGGKDSHFQTWLLTERYDMNPLLVSYNHSYNTRIGLRNLRNLIDKSGCNHIRFNTSKSTARKLSKYQLYKTGDVTWHYHAGIMTFPIRVAVMYNIPLIVWGESGYRYKFGMYNAEDMVEFTEKERHEHDMRGLQPEDILSDSMSAEFGITESDLEPFYYPSNDVIDDLDLRGIYLDNYRKWDHIKQTKKIIDEWDFATHPLGTHPSKRQFLCASGIEDAATGTHDYLKYLKYGYGRATDHVSREIRHGRMTREEGIYLVGRYDDVRPPDLDWFLEFMDMSEQEFEKAIEPFRDENIWSQSQSGEWELDDWVGNHPTTPGSLEEHTGADSGAHWTDVANPIKRYDDEEFITL